ncbi:MAG: sigma-70 family RNA polymerase sigma factor [Caldilineales bacterium]|nr:sigma-70 family RNA polymerase sigma factor [Caldilineales bacterium]MDW8318172.1 sigma-70 family RNA polymerase sigma factor [Anaerolineae bacterium]
MTDPVGDPRSPTDQELVHRITQSDEGALMLLYERYGGQVYSLALRVLRNPALAEEATQDTFLKVWHKGVQWSPSKGLFSSWLLTVARYTAIDHLRRERRQVLSRTTPPEVAPWASARLPSVDTPRWQDGQVLRTLMEQLPAEQRTVIELAFYQGMTHSELAEHLGWPLGTVKTRLRLGLQKLRSLWQEATQR